METCDIHPKVDVQDAEYYRLLGWPRGHVPEERALELAAWARAWYAEHGRPWVYWRRVDLAAGESELRLDGVSFDSARLRDHLQENAAQGAVLVAVSAGSECEEHARQLWQEGRPDEYFFLEVFGSAVVEDLVARISGRLCAEAGREGLMAVPHYSPGYPGWDIAEQGKLFALISHGLSRPLPGPVEVLPSGMLRPKKSLLAVFGLAAAKPGAAAPAATPCENCSFAPCQYRRATYRHAGRAVAPEAASLTANATYSVNPRALRKWARERVRVELRADGTVEAVFRFDGTTCSNMGQPLAFDYRVAMTGPDQGYRILESSCTPAPGEEGYQSTCAYLNDPDGLMQEIAAERPLVGRPLDDVLTWNRPVASAGCPCTADSRAHKWGLALEAIHFALAQDPAAPPAR
ncbi:MAG: hypothetical protein WDM96_00655 [Lacunisphaera sp.]